jgi:hypothetical protein
MDMTLHLGAHRTATRTLDRLMAANLPALREAGLAYWGRAELHAGFYDGLLGRPDRLGPEMAVRAARSLGALEALCEVLEVEGTRRLIVSAPRLIGSVTSVVAEGALYPLVSERLERLAPVLQPRCDRVVLTIRAYQTHWSSLAAEAVRRGAAPPGQQTRARMASCPVTWRRLIEEIAMALPEAGVVVMPYEAVAGRWDLILRLLGAPPRLPRALSPGRDRLARGLGAGKLRMMRAERGEAAPIVPEGAPAAAQARWVPFTPAEAAAMTQAYAEDLAWLRSGASGLASWIESADATLLRPPDRTRGRPPDDRRKRAQVPCRLGEAG